MLSSVLNSDRAIRVNIAIMRAFVRLRETAATNRDHGVRIDALERHFEDHDATIAQVFEAIRALTKPESTCKRIGFVGQKSE